MVDAREPVWTGGLILSGVALLLALGVLALLIPNIRVATSEVPELTPASIKSIKSTDSIELDDFHPLLVEARGFELDCDDRHYDGKQLLVWARPPERDTAIAVALDYGSDCRSLGASLRGDARLRNWFSTQEVEPFVVIEPRRFPRRTLALALGLAGLGLLGIALALASRRRLQAEPRAAVRESERDPEVEQADPYRPDRHPRLITEPLRPSLVYLAKLRHQRTRRLGSAVLVLAATLIGAPTSGLQIYECEQIWQAGRTPLHVEIAGQSEQVGFGLVRTTVVATYIDDHGQLQRERVTASSLGSSPNTAITPALRFSPEQPERFTVSWIHEQLRGSLILLGLITAGLLGVGAALLVTTTRDRSLERTLVVFEDPREVLLDLLGVDRQHPGADRDQLTYNFRLRDSARCCSVFVARGQSGPLFLDRRGTVALALYNPRERAGLLVLSEDLHELEQPPFGAAQLRERYRESEGAPLQPTTPSRPPRRRRRRSAD